MSDVRWSEDDEAELSRARKAELADLVCSLLEGSDRARMLELRYWSEEPELLDIMRVIVGLTDETREALHTFLTRASAAQEITALSDLDGQLSLSGPVRCAAVLPFRRPRSSGTPR